MIYSGQTAGFRLEELNDVVEQIKKFKNVRIEGVTSFPCFLYDENEEKKNHCHAAGYSTACMWMSADIKSNR